MLTAMIPQKPRASAALRSRPHFQSGRRNRRAREHRSGQRRECRERTARRRSRRSGAQRACRLRGRLDIGHSRRIERHCGCQNDKVGRDVGVEHATPSIPADAAQFSGGIHPDGYGYSRFVALGFMLCGRRVRILGKGNKIRMCPLWPATKVLLSRLVSGRAANEAVQASHRRRLDARADQTAGRRDRAQYRRVGRDHHARAISPGARIPGRGRHHPAGQELWPRPAGGSLQPAAGDRRALLHFRQFDPEEQPRSQTARTCRDGPPIAI
jgi:hypothetical protein